MVAGECARQDVRLVEDVAFLSVFDALPGESFDNPLPSGANDRDRGRVLSFAREHFLASGLAVLAEISDDPNHVVAVAIEERQNTQGLAVVIAINRENAASAQGTMAKIKRGLQDIFSVLARVRDDSSTSHEYEVFDAILNLCRRRILQRLGSARVRAHNVSRSASYLGKSLDEVRDALLLWSKQRRVPVQDRSTVESFLGASQDLRSLLEELESCPESSVNRKLRDLVSIARTINKLHQLPMLLRSMPHRNLQPSTRDSFLTRLRELARYREISRHLFQSATNIALLRNAEVNDVSLDDACFARALCPHRFSTIDGCLARCVHGKLNTAKLCRNRGKTIPGATRELAATARRGFTESKIHAEIQIVTFYELNPPDLLPRLICSNKDACYLCDRLIKTHGVFYIPRSHGKLYPGWRLPHLPVFDQLISKLQQILESEISLFYQENVHTGRRRPPVHGWSERADVGYSDSMSTLPSSPSRPTSPVATPALPSTDLDSQPYLSPDHGLPGPLQTITESPPHSPISDDDGSASSDASTVKPSPGERTRTDAEVTSGSSPVSRCASVGKADQLDSPARDKGRVFIPDDTERAVPQHSDLGDEYSSASTTPPGCCQDISEQDAHRVATSEPRIGSGLKHMAGLSGESTDDTRPKEAGPERVANVDKGKGNQEAEDHHGSEKPQGLATGQAQLDHVHVVLAKGAMAKCRLNSGQDPPSYSAGLLTIIPEFVREVRAAKSAGTCELHIEWLSDAERERITRATDKVTDVQIMEAVDVDSGSPRRVILEHGSVMVRMHVVRS